MHKSFISTLAIASALLASCVPHAALPDSGAVAIRRQQENQVYGPLTQVMSITSSRRLGADCVYTFSERFEDASGATVEMEPDQEGEGDDLLLEIDTKDCSHTPSQVIRLGNIPEQHYARIESKIKALLGGGYHPAQANLVLPTSNPDAILLEGSVYVLLYSSGSDYKRARVDLSGQVPVVLSIDSWQ